VAGHPSSRRPRGNGPTVNIPLTDSRLNYAKQIFEATSGGTHTNTSQTRNFGPSIDVGNSNHRHRNHPASVLESSMRDVERILGRPTESTTHEQQAFPTQSSRRASAPLYHTGSAGNKNEQMTSLQPAHVPESITSVFQPGNVVQQYSEQWPVIEATRSPSDKPDDASAQADAMEQHNPDKHDLQETTSKSLCNEIEPNVPEPTHLASSQAGDVSEAGHPRAISISSRVPSRAQSEVLERPQSRRSNCGKPITRPMPPQDLRPQGASETIPHRGSRSTKIKKSNSGSTNPIPSEASTKHAASGQHRQQSRPSPKFFEDYKNFLENGQKFLDTMKDYEQQSQLVEAQKAEIEKLRDTSDSSIKQIKALESEKADLTDKLKKFADISSKYKKHMNDVVKAQKYLKSQANEIQKNTKEAVESMKKEGETHTATHTATKAALQKIEIAITDAKSIRAPAEKFALGE
jgi:hypothetical protein